MSCKRTRENYCGDPHKKDTVEGYGQRPQGCAYSTGDYNTMGNPAAAYGHNAMAPAGLREGYCKSCRAATERVPTSYKKEMSNGRIEEGFCKGCGGGDYNVFNYDMVEGYSRGGNARHALGNMNFPPAWVTIPHQFVNNMKLSIEDPDNRYTYWLGGSPCPCKGGPNESAPRRNWFGVSN